MRTGRRLGAHPGEAGGCDFTVWAPFAERVEVRLRPGEAEERTASLESLGHGYHAARIEDAPPGTDYYLVVEPSGGGPGALVRPDPASRFQPEGVHGPSRIVDLDFAWSDGGWRGIERERHVFYELHVGTFTEEGTFDAARGDLDRLAELGITAVELMPVAAFPGRRNWGYDGVHPYAVQASYGGPEGLARFVDACHARGLAVVLDVVYNHLGPEGNYLADFGPYFTDRYRTPWGAALNFDGPDSDEVRRYFVDNALHWIRDYHVDALRLDAVHAILDVSARPFLQELAEAVDDEAARSGRLLHLFPESDANDPRLLRARPAGYGMGAVWSDDFHHALHALLTGESFGYYVDYGGIEPLARSMRDGFAYTGQRSAYRRRRHGAPPTGLGADRFVVCAQNHDQVGNRMQGERLASLVGFEATKLAVSTVLLSPFLPLLFMGEEYAERAPFPFFIDHGDPDLLEAVRRGRRRELEAFGWQGDPPDPAALETWLSARLDRSRREEPEGRAFESLVARLLDLRLRVPALAPGRCAEEVVGLEEPRLLLVARRAEGSLAVHFHHFGAEARRLELSIPSSLRAAASGASFRKILDTAAEQWGGPGATLPAALGVDAPSTLSFPPHSAAAYTVSRGTARSQEAHS